MQIEYALHAVGAGATSLGIKAKNGVVIATEKKLPSALIDEETVQKIALLTPHIGAVYSGMGPDARMLVRKARKQAQAYFRTYHESEPAAQLVRETAAVMQEFTQSGCVRRKANPSAVASRARATGACAPLGFRCSWLATTTQGRSCTRWTPAARTLRGRRRRLART